MSAIYDAYMEAYGQDQPPAQTQRPRTARQTKTEWVAEQFSRMIDGLDDVIDVDVDVGFDREGNRYAKVKVRTTNPLAVAERAASRMLKAIAGQDVSVSVNVPGTEKEDLEFVFSTGVEAP